jgi:hypothetical protein
LEKIQTGKHLIAITKIAYLCFPAKSFMKESLLNSSENVTAIAKRITCCKTTAIIAGHMKIK